MRTRQLLHRRGLVSAFAIASLFSTSILLSSSYEARADDPERWYLVAYDQDPLGIDGIVANITVVPTMVSEGMAVWCGFFRTKDWQIQTGWNRMSNSENPTVYYEYNQGPNVHVLQEKWGATTQNYSIYRSNNDFYVGYFEFVISPPLPVSDFRYTMCVMEAGVELFSFGERVPGQVGAECILSNIAYRRLGQFGYSTPSFSHVNQSLYGNITVIGNTVKTWDCRNWFEDTCP